MCEVFEVSRSGYYRWLKNKGIKEEKSSSLNEQIKTVFKTSKSTYGSPRVCIALKKLNIEVSKSTVARHA